VGACAIRRQRACGTRWREAAVDLFVECAAAFGAFYAAASTTDGWIAKGSRLWADGQTIGDPTVCGAWWDGIPDVPVWLTWFGEPYRRLVEPALDGLGVRRRDEGIAVRLSDEPCNRSELAGRLPRYPPELLAHRSPPTTTFSWNSESAAVIPGLD